MRLENIMGLVRDYIILGLIATGIVTVIVTFIYKLIYQKWMKGKKKMQVGKVVWLILFLGYLLMMLEVTMLNRANGDISSVQWHLFYSYREAWNSFSTTQWRNIILNIFMFTPLGFLLPVGLKGMRKAWKVYLVGLALTIGIEVTQLVTKRGVFESDDIFDNLLGTMIGYGLFALCQLVVDGIRKKQIRPIQTLLLQIPLVGTIVLFGIIFISYDRQELGNLETRYVVLQDMSQISVSTTEQYSKEKSKAAIYQVKKATVEETKEQAKAFFENLGSSLDESRNDIYQDTAVYYDVDGNSLWIDYLGSTISYSNYGLLFPEDDGDEQEAETDTESEAETKDEENTERVGAKASEQQVRQALQNLGVELPKGASFKNQGDGDYCFEAQQLMEDDVLYDGTLYCTYAGDGQFAEVQNGILTCELYREAEILSEQEAYQQICEGKFRAWNLEEGELETGKSSLIYLADSKGFYQPVYSFSCEVDEEENEILIPALRSVH